MSSIKLLPKALELAKTWTKNPGLENPLDPTALLQALQANVSGHSTIPETFEKACIERVNHLAMNCESEADQIRLLEAAGYPDLKSLQDAGQRIAEQADRALSEAHAALYGEPEEKSYFDENPDAPHIANDAPITPSPEAVAHINAKMAEMDKYYPKRDTTHERLTGETISVFQFCEAIRKCSHGTPTIPETFEEDYHEHLRAVYDLIPNEKDKENFLTANWLLSLEDLEVSRKELKGSAKKIQRQLQEELDGPVM